LTEADGPVGVQHRSLRATVLDELRDAIVTGRLAPGTRLLEDQLAGDLGVSRFPVREALGALAGEGFVEIVPRRGARVASFPPERCRDLFELREVLEGLVCRLAADRAGPDQIAELRAVVDEGRRALETGEAERLPVLHTRFHRLLTDAAGNVMVAEQIERTALLLEWIYAGRLRDRMATSWREHGAIVAAVADGDPDRAEQLARRHVAGARAALLGDAPAAGGDAPEEDRASG